MGRNQAHSGQQIIFPVHIPQVPDRESNRHIFISFPCESSVWASLMTSFFSFLVERETTKYVTDKRNYKKHPGAYSKKISIHMAPILFYIHLWPYTVRNGFKAELTESHGTVRVANPRCQRGNTKQNGKLWPYKSVNITSVLLHHSHQSRSLVVSCWSNTSTNASQENCNNCPFIPVLILMSCSASYAAPQTTYLERDPAFVIRWPSLHVRTMERCSLLQDESQCLREAAPLNNSPKESLYTQWF